MLSLDDAHLPFPYLATLNGRFFEDFVLVDNRQNVTTKLSHLTIILLNHFHSAGDIQRSSRLFENRYLGHGSRHRYDLLTTIVGDKEVSRRSHFGGVFRYLAKFKMSDSSVDSHVADAVKKFAAFAVAAPRFKQFTSSIALVSFPKSTAWTI